MQVENLQEFIVLAEEHNYQVAADRLYTTQATLSRHIIAMEAELGVQLLERSSKRVSLTDAGVRFLSYAHRGMEAYNALLSALEAERRSRNGSLTVGYNGSVSFYNFTRLLGRFMMEHPEATIAVTENAPGVLLRQVMEGECDVAIVMENPYTSFPAGLKHFPIATDRMVAILPRDHPLSGRSSIPLEALKGEKFVTSSVSKEPGSIFWEACRRRGFQPALAHTGIIGAAALELVRSTKYISLDWEMVARHHGVEGVALVPAVPPLETHVTVLYAAGEGKPGRRQLLRFLRDNAAPGGGDGE